jgi:hypothetical protein
VSLLRAQLIGCHQGHLLELGWAVMFYLLVWPLTFPEAGTWSVGWVSKVVAFNLASEVIWEYGQGTRGICAGDWAGESATRDGLLRTRARARK